MFQKATKKRSRLRKALVGPAGAGKTFSALRIARGIAGAEGKVALIDSERGSASKYADRFDFDVVEVLTGHPNDYIKAITAAGAAGYSVLIIDSLSHAWEGRDGSALQLVDDEKARQRKENGFTAWRNVTPLHNQLIDAILMSPCHVIATMRSKMKHVQEEVDGKVRIRKLGMEAIQRQGMEYEFDVVGDMDDSNTLTITKTRCPDLARAIVREPDEALGERLRVWLDDGEEPVAPPLPVAAPKSAAATKAAPVLQFGPNRGTRIEKLTMEELEASIALGWKRFEEDPEAPWASRLRSQLEHLDEELHERRKELERPPVLPQTAQVLPGGEPSVRHAVPETKTVQIPLAVN